MFFSLATQTRGWDLWTEWLADIVKHIILQALHCNSIVRLCVQTVNVSEFNARMYFVTVHSAYITILIPV